MCNYCDEQDEKKIPTLELGQNIIRNHQKAVALPGINRHTGSWIEDGDMVELVLLCDGNVSVECMSHPIRFGNYFGSRLFFNTMSDKFNLNPKFVFDNEKKQWVLMNAGYVCFAEMELDHKSNHKLYGQKDA